MSDSNMRKGLTLAIILHGVLFLAMVGGVLLEKFRKDPEEIHVFEMVSPSPPAPAMRTVPEPAMDPEPEPQIEYTPEPVNVPEMRDLELPEPPPPPPEPKPQPKPEPKPQPKPEPKKVSYEEWAKNRDLPDRVQKKTVQPKRTTEVPQIETNVRTRLQEALSDIQITDSRPSSQAQLDAFQAYAAGLRSRLKAAFRPVGQGLEAEVGFTVLASGRWTNMRILRSSGDPIFDRAALDTFNRARPMGPPPGNRSYDLKITFKSLNP